MSEIQNLVSQNIRKYIRPMLHPNIQMESLVEGRSVVKNDAFCLEVILKPYFWKNIFIFKNCIQMLGRGLDYCEDQPGWAPYHHTTDGTNMTVIMH